MLMTFQNDVLSIRFYAMKKITSLGKKTFKSSNDNLS
jgi:hypothetical protein